MIKSKARECEIVIPEIRPHKALKILSESNLNDNKKVTFSLKDNYMINPITTVDKKKTVKPILRIRKPVREGEGEKEIKIESDFRDETSLRMAIKTPMYNLKSKMRHKVIRAMEQKCDRYKSSNCSIMNKLVSNMQ